MSLKNIATKTTVRPKKTVETAVETPTTTTTPAIPPREVIDSDRLSQQISEAEAYISSARTRLDDVFNALDDATAKKGSRGFTRKGNRIEGRRAYILTLQSIRCAERALDDLHDLVRDLRPHRGPLGLVGDYERSDAAGVEDLKASRKAAANG